MNETVVLCEQCDKVLMPEQAKTCDMFGLGKPKYFCSEQCRDNWNEELIDAHR